MAKYYTLVTDVGRAKMANAQVMGQKVSFSQIALGSSETKPRENQTALGKEEWRGPISNVSLDKDNPNWIVVEAVVPSHVGGFEIAEVGVYDEEGHLIVVGNHPKTYKPKMDEGTTKDVAIRIIIEVSNSEIVELKVDPSVVIATRSYVESAIELAMASIDFSTVEKQIDQHVSNTDVHVTAKDKSNWNAKETPEGAQAKASEALKQAKQHAEQIGENVLKDAKAYTQESASTLDLSNNPQMQSVQELAQQAFQSGNEIKKNVASLLLSLDPTLQINADASWEEIISAITSFGENSKVKFAKVSMTVYEERDKKGYYASGSTYGLSFKPNLIVITTPNEIPKDDVIFNDGTKGKTMRNPSNSTSGLYLDLGLSSLPKVNFLSHWREAGSFKDALSGEFNYIGNSGFEVRFTQWHSNIKNLDFYAFLISHSKEE